MGNIKYILLHLFVFFLAAAIYLLYKGGDSDLARNLIYLVPPLMALLAGMLTLKAYGTKNMHGKALLFIVLGLFFWFLGEVAWAIFELVLRIEPFPSLADIIYLAGYPLFFYGLFLEYKIGKIRLTPARLLLNSVIIILLGGLTVYFGIFPAYSADNTLLENIASLAYGFADLILSIMVLLILWLIIEYKQGKIFYPWFYFFIGVLLMLAADLLFGVYFNEYTDGPIAYRNILDFLWMGSYLFYSLSFLVNYNIIKQATKKIASKA